jgi:hypothetical protein
MAAYDQSGGWDKKKNHFLVYPHDEVDSEDAAKLTTVTTVDGSTRASVAKMKQTK